MRRSLIAKGDCPAPIHFAPRLAFHQQGNAPCQQRQFFLLPRDDVGQIINAAQQMRDLFFEVLGLGHGTAIHRSAAGAKALAAPHFEYLGKKEAGG